MTRDSLRDMLANSDAVKIQHIVGRALVVLLNNQTRDEQASNTTNRNNGVGFAGMDARGGSLTAKSYLKNRSLQDWQVQKWTKPGSNGYPRLCKYWLQLDMAAKEKLQ